MRPTTSTKYSSPGCRTLAGMRKVVGSLVTYSLSATDVDSNHSPVAVNPARGPSEFHRVT